MSFILDAIAKSEQERRQQQAPDARSLAFPAAAPARSRRTAPYLLAGLLLLGSAILATVWIQSPRLLITPVGGSGGSAVPTAPEAAGQPQAPVESPDAQPAAPADTPEPVSAKPMLADSAPVETVARAQSPVGEKVLTPAVDSAIEAPATDPPAESTPGSAAIARSSEIDAGDSRLASLETDPEASGPGTPAAVQTSPPQTEAPRRRVSRLSELPADVRRALPSVVFTGHLYSRNPRASYVFIDDGRQVVAGQQITDDLVLDEITPNGVVVEFQGYLIEVGVLQNWSLK
jgi:general secretion pathway protein B